MLSKRIKDEKGKRYGELTVIRFAGFGPYYNALWYANVIVVNLLLLMDRI
jgi:hypothetical protein